MNEPAIWTENLGKSFRSVRALQGLNLGVPPGCIYGLLGPNGAGKTTTIKLLMNLLAPSEGRATVLGRPTTGLDWSDFRRIGYVSENQVLPEHMGVGELLAYLAPYYPAWDAALAESLLGQFQLPPHRRLRDLSRGMKMKASLLASIAFRPELIVLDEPFSGLDPVARDDFSQGLLGSIPESDWTVFLSSHDVEEVERLCDWIGIMAPGRLLISEPIEQLLGRFQRIEITLPEGSPPPAIAGPEILRVESSGTGLSLVHQGFRGDETLAALHAALPLGTALEHAPMTLRDIYLVLARNFTPASAS